MSMKSCVDQVLSKVWQGQWGRQEKGIVCVACSKLRVRARKLRSTEDTELLQPVKCIPRLV